MLSKFFRKNGVPVIRASNKINLGRQSQIHFNSLSPSASIIGCQGFSRNFSSATKGGESSSSGSIFDNADWMKEET